MKFAMSIPVAIHLFWLSLSNSDIKLIGQIMFMKYKLWLTDYECIVPIHWKHEYIVQ